MLDLSWLLGKVLAKFRLFSSPLACTRPLKQFARSSFRSRVPSALKEAVEGECLPPDAVGLQGSKSCHPVEELVACQLFKGGPDGWRVYVQVLRNPPTLTHGTQLVYS
jgi:hypothetical protein